MFCLNFSLFSKQATPKMLNGKTIIANGIFSKLKVLSAIPILEKALTSLFPNFKNQKTEIRPKPKTKNKILLKKSTFLA
jgi:hypothetical protein